MIFIKILRIFFICIGIVGIILVGSYVIKQNGKEIPNQESEKTPLESSYMNDENTTSQNQQIERDFHEELKTDIATDGVILQESKKVGQDLTDEQTTSLREKQNEKDQVEEKLTRHQKDVPLKNESEESVVEVVNHHKNTESNQEHENPKEVQNEVPFTNSSWANDMINQHKDEVSQKDLQTGLTISEKIDTNYILNFASDGFTESEKEQVKQYLSETLTEEEYQQLKSLFNKYNYLIQ